MNPFTVKNPASATSSDIIESHVEKIGRKEELLNYHFQDDTFTAPNLEPANISVEMLQAMYIKTIHSLGLKAQETVWANEQGYLTPYQAKNPTAKVATCTRKRVLSTREYLENEIKANLVTLSITKLSDLLELLIEGSSEVKAESFKSLFITEEKEQMYISMIERDKEDAERYKSLKEAGFDNIRATDTENVLSAQIATENFGSALTAMSVMDFQLLASESDLVSKTTQVTIKIVD